MAKRLFSHSCAAHATSSETSGGSGPTSADGSEAAVHGGSRPTLQKTGDKERLLYCAPVSFIPRRRRNRLPQLVKSRCVRLCPNVMCSDFDFRGKDKRTARLVERRPPERRTNSARRGETRLRTKRARARPRSTISWRSGARNTSGRVSAVSYDQGRSCRGLNDE